MQQPSFDDLPLNDDAWAVVDLAARIAQGWPTRGAVDARALFIALVDSSEAFAKIVNRHVESAEALNDAVRRAIEGVDRTETKGLPEWSAEPTPDVYAALRSLADDLGPREEIGLRRLSLAVLRASADAGHEWPAELGLNVQSIEAMARDVEDALRGGQPFLLSRRPKPGDEVGAEGAAQAESEADAGASQTKIESDPRAPRADIESDPRAAYDEGYERPAPDQEVDDATRPTEWAADADLQRAAEQITATVAIDGEPVCHATLWRRGVALMPHLEALDRSPKIEVIDAAGTPHDAHVAVASRALRYAILTFEGAALQERPEASTALEVGTTRWRAFVSSLADDEPRFGEGRIESAGLLLSLGTILLGAGAAGSPLFDQDGRLIGVHHGAQGDDQPARATALPIGLFLWDSRLADVTGEPAPRSRVGAYAAVAGPDATPEALDLATDLGRTLVAQRIGLRTLAGDEAGERAAIVMLDAGLAANAPPAIAVVDTGEGAGDLARFDVIESASDPEAQITHLTDRVRLVVALGQGPVVSGLVAIARIRGIAVTAPPVAFGGDDAWHNDTVRGLQAALDDSTDAASDELTPDALLGPEATTDRASAFIRGLVHRLFEQVAVPETDGFRGLAIASDAVGQGDLLNLKETAQRFAQIMVSRRVHPPLAIGLFGPWGSGKSHFMRLMRDECTQLTRSPDDTIWDRVTSIEFNAWHYMDQNLWASLAGNIFDGIARDLTRLFPDSIPSIDRPSFAEVRRGLTRRLRSTLEAEAEARAAEREAQEALAEARRNYDRVREQVRSSPTHRELLEYTWVALREAIGGEREAKKVQTAARRVLDEMGIEPDKDVVELLSKPSKELEELIGHARSTYASVRSLVTSPMGWVAVGVLAAGLVGTWVIPADDLGEKVLAAASAVGGALTLLGDLRGRMKSASTLGAFGETLKDFGDTIEKRAREEFAKRAREDEKKQRLEWLDKLRRAEAELAARSEEVRGLESSLESTRRELEDLRVGRAVYDFAIERVSRPDGYQSREGIVATVRRDLEDLTRLLGTFVREAGQDETPGWQQRDPEQLDLTEGVAETGLDVIGDDHEQAAALARIRDEDERKALPIQRIVLYIDDLDRCPRDRVVEVLQAVHLLLAFDLFVVVVGVDPRWLERSLASTYGDLLGEEVDAQGNRIGAAQLASARPHDYLEKIFQIPFTLPMLEDTGFGSLVDFHLPTQDEAREREEKSAQLRSIVTGAAGGTPGESAATGGGGQPPTTGQQGEAGASNAQGDASAGGGEGDAGTGGTSVSGGGTTGTPATPPGEQPTDAADPSSGAPSPEIATGAVAAAPQADAAESKKLFYVETWERDYLRSLWRFMDTPRAVKRFTNIYRLVRLASIQAEKSTTLDPQRYREFVGSKATPHSGGYRRVAMLLAINVGLPQFAARLFRRLLEECEDGDPKENGANGVRHWKGPDAMTLGDLLDMLTDDESPDPSEGLFVKPPSKGLEAEFARDRRRLIELLEHFEADHDWEIEDLAPTIRRVGRYSMYWREV